VQRLARIYVARGREQSLSLRAADAEQTYPSQDDAFDTTPTLLRRMGFGVGIHSQEQDSEKATHIPLALALPYWFLCLLAAPLPLAWTIRFRRRQRIARRSALGLCIACGYDLRATPDAGGGTLPICPECGATATQAKTLPPSV
jgi:hypothetical protein